MQTQMDEQIMQIQELQTQTDERLQVMTSACLFFLYVKPVFLSLFLN